MFVEIRFATLLNAREQRLAVGSMALEKWMPDAASGIHFQEFKQNTEHFIWIRKCYGPPI